VVTITLFSDVPAPRCAVVSAGQHLRLLNSTGGHGEAANTVSLDFAGFAATIPPGHAVVLDAPIGQYIQPGVTAIPLHGAPGPELWLRRGGSKSG
jgi:hypothetical protein